MIRTGNRLTILCILGVAAAVRMAALAVYADRLAEDPDGYRGIAARMAAGEGFSVPSSGAPTAYRPPLYPVLLGILMATGADDRTIGVVHVAFGVLTVWLTIVCCRQLGFGSAAWLAGLFVAIDPMLIVYSTQVMSETTAALLVTLLLVTLCSLHAPSTHTQTAIEDEGSGSERSRSSNAVQRRIFRALCAGIVFGLCVLCRPSLWVAAVMCIPWVLTRWRPRSQVLIPNRQVTRDVIAFVIGTTVTVMPWIVRNWFVFGQLIIATTHGGYTLLLANNPVFYEEVVSAPFGTVWKGESLARWQRSIEQQMERDGIPGDEPRRDRWMYRRAFENIASSPSLFVRSCVHRFMRFWNVIPMGPARTGQPSILVVASAVFYCVVIAGIVLFAIRRPGQRHRARYLIVAIASLALVHTVYWCNARMRAPVIPAIAVIAACGLIGRSSATEPTRDAASRHAGKR